MDSLKLMNKAMAFIEDHLTEDIDMEQVSRLVEHDFLRITA